MEVKDYKKRLVDKQIETYLNVFGAILIEGPKWCGKTWTGLYHSNSVSYVTQKSVKEIAEVNPAYIFSDDKPQLIDEWQIVPEIWDSVRHECDKDHNKGKFILTGSTSYKKQQKEKKVFHSGAGRIAPIQMDPMSLYESNDSSGNASIIDMYSGKQKIKKEKDIELYDIANLIIRGGWPENIFVDKNNAGLIPKSYIKSIVEVDIHERNENRIDSNKMMMLIKSLARNESTVVGNKTLLRDIEDYSTDDEYIKSRNTIDNYISILDDLFFTYYQPAFNINYRSSSRVGKSSKRHLIDPSLSCAALNINVDKLMNDHETFGLLFEGLVERDLKIYMNYLNGKLYHFRDNTSGDEVDAILEFEDGQYAAVEIKLTYNGINEGIESLKKFKTNVKKKPKFMCIVVGYLNSIMIDKETGIYIVPITSLRP